MTAPLPTTDNLIQYAGMVIDDIEPLDLDDRDHLDLQIGRLAASRDVLAVVLNILNEK